MSEGLSRAIALGSNLRAAQYVYAYALLVSICHAFPLITKRQDDKTYTHPVEDDDELTAQGGAAGAILFISGVILWLFGRRMYRITLFIIGFYIGVIGAYVGLVNFEPDEGYGDNPSQSRTIYVVVPVINGLLNGLGMTFLLTRFPWCNKVVYASIGGVTGYATGFYMQAWSTDGMIKNRDARLGIIVVCTIIGIGAGLYYKLRPVGMITAFVGAFSLMLGVDMFARTGFATCLRAFIDRKRDIKYTVENKTYAILAGIEIIFIIGFLIQKRYHKDCDFGPDKAPEQKEESKDGRWWHKLWKKNENANEIN